MSTPVWNLSAVIVFGVVAIACVSRAEAPPETNGREAAPPSAVAESTPTPVDLVSGRVVDASTGQGLPCIKVWLYESGENAGEAVLTDGGGRFEAPRTGDRPRLRFRDAVTGKLLGGMPVPSSTNDVVYEAHVGPTLIVRLDGAPNEAVDWRLRLFEHGRSPYLLGWSRVRREERVRVYFPQSTRADLPLPDAGERPSSLEEDRVQPGAWSWLSPQVLEEDGVLVARYAKQEITPLPDHLLRIQIVDSEGVWQGEREIESLCGVISTEVHVAPVRALLSGRVVDEDGHAVAADVVAFPHTSRDSSKPASVVSTRFDGTWRMKDVAPGLARVLVFSQNRAVQRADVELALGRDTPLQIVLPRATSAADVNGALVGPARGEDPAGIVCLESEDGAWSPRPWVQAKLTTAGRALFAFENVPSGDRRLNVLALDGRSYTAPAASVTAPGYVEFTTQQSDSPHAWASYDLSLRDSITHSELLSGSFLVGIAPLWCGSVIHADPLQSLARLGEDAPVALLIGHPDHQPALLRLPEALRAVRREDDRVDVVLELQRGHGAGLIVLDAERAPRAFLNPSKRGDWTHSSRWNWSRLDEFLPMRGLQGARIISRGQVVGTSDELGVALCVSDEPIRRFEVELQGWTMVDVQGFRGDEEVSPCLGYVLMVRD